MLAIYICSSSWDSFKNLYIIPMIRQRHFSFDMNFQLYKWDFGHSCSYNCILLGPQYVQNIRQFAFLAKVSYDFSFVSLKVHLYQISLFFSVWIYLFLFSCQYSVHLEIRHFICINSPKMCIIMKFDFISFLEYYWLAVIYHKERNSQ